MGVELTTSEGITREGAGASADFPSPLIADLFAAKTVGRGAMTDGVGGVTVAQLKSIDAAAAAEDKQGMEQLAQALDFGLTGDLSAQLVGALRDRYGVTINQAAIQAHFFRDAGYP